MSVAQVLKACRAPGSTISYKHAVATDNLSKHTIIAMFFTSSGSRNDDLKVFFTPELEWQIIICS